MSKTSLSVQRSDHAETVEVDRVDYAPLPKAVRTEEGYLKAPATNVARIGVQKYRRDDGGWQTELRLPEHVFDSASLSTLDGKPLVHKHPRSGLVDAANARSLVRGSVSAPRRDGEFLSADLTIYDEDTILAVGRGDSEISLGYKTELVPIPGGVFKQDGHPLDGTKADFLQTNIRHNHAALLRAGRANEGSKDRPVRLRLDGAGNQLSDEDGEVSTMKMVKIKIDGTEFEVPESVALHLQQLEKRNDEAEKLYSEADDKAKAASKTASEQKARADEAEAKLGEVESKKQKDADAKQQAERFALLKQAEAVTKKDAAEFCGLDNNQLRRAILKAKRPSLNLDGEDDSYVKAALQFASEANSASSLRRPQPVVQRDDASESPLTKFYAEREEKQKKSREQAS